MSNRVTEYINLNLIKIDRIPLDQKTLLYADLIKKGVEFPPIKIAKVGNGTYEIRDGRHRYTANKLLGHEKIKSKFSLTPLRENHE